MFPTSTYPKYLTSKLQVFVFTAASSRAQLVLNIIGVKIEFSDLKNLNHYLLKKLFCSLNLDNSLARY